jgi:hypothetical protein
MSTALAGVQQAIFALLSNDVTLTLANIHIYDEVPEDATFPYIVIGDASETPMDTFGRKGRRPAITLELYSQYFGFKEILTLIERVEQLLNRANLTIAKFDEVYCMITHVQVERESDGLTRKAIMQFDLYAEEINVL